MSKVVKFVGLLICVVAIGLFGAGDVKAHPGNTASDGCHYCRTRCDYWGVPWNQRHCHGGYIPPQATTQPYIPPSPKPSPLPSPKPTPSSSPTPSPSPSPSPTPEVKGESTETPPSPIVVGSQEETSEGNTLAGLITLAVVGGGAFWIFRSIRGRFKKDVAKSDNTEN